MKKKIAIVTSGFLPVPATKGGAVENLIFNLIKENEKNETFEFIVFSIYDKSAQDESINYKKTKFQFYNPKKIILLLDKIFFFIAKNILKKKNSQTYRYIFQRLFFLNFISKNIKNNNYDNILLENHPTQYLCLKLRKNYKKYNGKVIYHCHNEFPGTFGLKKIIEKTDKFVCVSSFIKQQLSNYLKIDENKFYILRNCVDEKIFNTNIDRNDIVEIRKKYEINYNDFVIIFTGRIVPEKGVLELLKSIEIIDRNNIKIMIVGSALNALQTKTDYQLKIEKMIEKIKDKVLFTGFVDYNEIPNLYKISDLAVIPSIWDDPAPLTIIESIMCGLPIITTNSGGIPEYVNSNNAIVLDKNDDFIEKLSIEIVRLIDDEKLRKKMSKESVTLSKKMNVKNYYENFEKIIK